MNIDGYWINPVHVVSVVHHSPEQYSEQKVIVTTVANRFVLDGGTARQACQVVDKLEGAPTE